MLIALNNQNQRIDSYSAVQGDTYHCPLCGDEMIAKQGRIKIWHFAHKSGSYCHTDEPETPEHLEMKQKVWSAFARKPYVTLCEPEYIIDNLRADVFVQTKFGNIAVECQRSAIGVDYLEDKLSEYTRNRIHALYIVHHSVIGLGGEKRIPAWVQALHSLYFGRVYTYRDSRVLPAHFAPVTRYKELAHDENGEEVGGYDYTLRSTRYVQYGNPVKASTMICTDSMGSSRLLSGWYYIARFPDRVFWK